MRSSKILSITLPPAMLEEAERLAKKENRTKSELVREALRQYMQAREWEAIHAYGSAKAKELGINEKDVERLIHEYRQEKRKKPERLKKTG